MSKLTDREVQIVQMLADGLTMKQIASEIGISEQRAKNHAYDIRNKTGMDTTTAAIAWCLRNKCIE